MVECKSSSLPVGIRWFNKLLCLWEKYRHPIFFQNHESAYCFMICNTNTSIHTPIVFTTLAHNHCFVIAFSMIIVLINMWTTQSGGTRSTVTFRQPYCHAFEAILFTELVGKMRASDFILGHGCTDFIPKVLIQLRHNRQPSNITCVANFPLLWKCNVSTIRNMPVNWCRPNALLNVSTQWGSNMPQIRSDLLHLQPLVLCTKFISPFSSTSIKDLYWIPVPCKWLLGRNKNSLKGFQFLAMGQEEIFICRIYHVVAGYIQVLGDQHLWFWWLNNHNCFDDSQTRRVQSTEKRKHRLVG